VLRCFSKCICLFKSIRQLLIFLIFGKKRPQEIRYQRIVTLSTLPVKRGRIAIKSTMTEKVIFQQYYTCCQLFLDYTRSAMTFSGSLDKSTNVYSTFPRDSVYQKLLKLVHFDGVIQARLWDLLTQCIVFIAQMALQFDVNPVINKFVNNIPYAMTKAPWYYNNTLHSGQQVTCQQRKFSHSFH